VKIDLHSSQLFESTVSGIPALKETVKSRWFAIPRTKASAPVSDYETLRVWPMPFLEIILTNRDVRKSVQREGG
jgi:hypothetical protein